MFHVGRTGVEKCCRNGSNVWIVNRTARGIQKRQPPEETNVLVPAAGEGHGDPPGVNPLAARALLSWSQDPVGRMFDARDGDGMKMADNRSRLERTGIGREN